MEDKQIIDTLFHYGHFYSPNTDQSLRVYNYDDLPASIQDVRAVMALQSYQGFLGPEFERLCQALHARSAIVDGELGPASLELLNVKRCGCPDYDIDDGALAESMNRSEVDLLEPAKVGSGSWPAPCQNEGIGVSVDHDRRPSGLTLERWQRIFNAVIRDYREMGCALVEVELHHPTDHEHIMISWKHGRGWIGLAEFNSQSCNDTVFNYLDITYTGSQNDDQIARLLCHELGHNMNLRHTRQGSGIMSPVITRGPYEGWEDDDASYGTLVRYFGGEPIEDPDDPPPDPPVDDVEVSGTILINGRPYQLWPAPQI